MSIFVMASNNSATSRAGAADTDLEKDTRPERSPYASELCTISFGDGKSLHVPRGLLCKVDHLFSGSKVAPAYKSCFYEMSSKTGHVLIHFLISGVYQCLRPQGDSLEERRVSEFKTALDVYAAAESLQLPRLRDLARQEITRLGDNLTLPSIISAIEDSGRSLKTLPGVVAYVESRILSFSEEATPEGVDEMLAELGRPESLSRTLLKAMVLLKRSELSKKPQKLHEDGGRGFCETAKSVSEEEMMMKRISPPGQSLKEVVAKAMAKKAEEEAIRAATAEEAIRAFLKEETIQTTKEEEACLEEEAELQTLRNKKYTRGGRLIGRDQSRLDELARRSNRRAEARGPYRPRSRAPLVASEGQAKVDPSFTFPAMDVTPTSEAFEVLNLETEAQEAKAPETPSSRSSGIWRLGSFRGIYQADIS
ncbi:hypothetical protein LCI18_015167 [Fusarium solani-melongenae]|uniref:Uncharacterized protein n=1 Tax=Fusarium solani subsp. cucurbitae TaxID=2747967 RepID=A0ACD3ZT83_FUSSC|nr:hypothetical protein LCI18_015167 [Fusarium solani-melongenae]